MNRWREVVRVLAGDDMLRFVPSLVGVFAFGAMAWFYGHAPAVYFGVLRFVGIMPWGHPFIDSSFMYAMKACFERGVDIYQGVPCDLDKVPSTRMAYSPLWPRLPFLPDDVGFRVPVGVVTDLLWIVSLALLPPARRWREVALVALVVPSTMVCFALERNNIDVWMYLLVVAGVVLLMRGGVLRWGGYGVFLLAGLLKYYPFVLFGLALREGKARFWGIAAGCGVALAVFVGVFWRELAEALPNVPTGSPWANLFGIVNIPLVLGTVAGQGFGAALVTILARLGLTAWVVFFAWRLTREPGLREGFEAMAGRERDWLVAGSLVVTGCYVMGQSVSYRGIYLMMVLSGLLALHRVVGAPEAKRQLWRAVVLLPAMMWNGAMLFWVSHVLPVGLAGGCEVGLWLFRELAWLNLARVLMAVLLVYAQGSLVWRR